MSKVRKKRNWDDAASDYSALREIVDHVVIGGGKSVGWTGSETRFAKIEKRLGEMNIGFAGGTFSIYTTPRVITMLLTVRPGPRMSDKYMTDYVRTAVRQWSKGGHPDDPLYDLTDEDIDVRVCK